jgi:hypothetical protein
MRTKEAKVEAKRARRKKRKQPRRHWVVELAQSGELCMNRRCRGDCGRWHLLR